MYSVLTSPYARVARVIPVRKRTANRGWVRLASISRRVATSAEAARGDRAEHVAEPLAPVGQVQDQRGDHLVADRVADLVGERQQGGPGQPAGLEAGGEQPYLLLDLLRARWRWCR